MQVHFSLSIAFNEAVASNLGDGYKAIAPEVQNTREM